MNLIEMCAARGTQQKIVRSNKPFLDGTQAFMREQT